MAWMTKGSIDWFTNLMAHAIKLRRQSEVQRDDILNSLIELQNKKNTSDIDIAVHGHTFFLDGFETSSQFLGGALVELAKNPDVQQKLREEILAYSPIGYDELCQMPYLDMVYNGECVLVNLRRVE